MPGGALTTFGLLNAVIGDEVCRAVAASGLLSCGLTEVSLVLGRATDDGTTILANALGALGSTEEFAGTGKKKSLSHFRMASVAAGDSGLDVMENVWAKPSLPLESLQVCFGSATDGACARQECRSSSWSDKRFSATNNFGSFMDEVVFKQIMLRTTHDGQPVPVTI